MISKSCEKCNAVHICNVSCPICGFNSSQTKKEGTKHDADKLPIGEMLQDFEKPLKEICKVWDFGAKKYDKSNWKKVENGSKRYTNAMIRHLLLETTEIRDPETQLHHAKHVAWNAIARLYFIIEEMEKQ